MVGGAGVTSVLGTSRARLLAAGAAGALLFALLATLVQAGPHWLRSLDHALGAGPERYAVEHDRARHLGDVVAMLTRPDFVVIPVVVLAIVLAVRGLRRAAVWSLIVIEASRWSYFVLKQIFGRHRPEWAHPAGHAPGWSFPSGHSTVIAGAAGIAVVLAIRLGPRAAVRAAVIVVALLVAVVVGFDRVLLGVHYPTDVLAGWLLGATITLLALAAFDPLPGRAGRRRANIAP